MVQGRSVQGGCTNLNRKQTWWRSPQRCGLERASQPQRCTYSKLARPARSYLMGASAVPSGRCGVTSSTRRWASFSSKSATPPIGEGRGCLPGRATGARARRCYTISLLVSQASRSPSAQQSDVGSRTRTFNVQSGTGLGRSGLRNWSECTITFVCAASEVIRNYLKTGILPAMTIDPIDEAADDLIVEDDSDSDY